MSMHADEESDEGIVPMKRSNNEGLPSGGDRGGKDLAQGKRRPGDRGPDTAPGYRVEPTGRRAPSGATEQGMCGSPRCCITSPSTS